MNSFLAHQARSTGIPVDYEMGTIAHVVQILGGCAGTHLFIGDLKTSQLWLTWGLGWFAFRLCFKQPRLLCPIRSERLNCLHMQINIQLVGHANARWNHNRKRFRYYPPVIGGLPTKSNRYRLFQESNRPLLLFDYFLIIFYWCNFYESNLAFIWQTAVNHPHLNWFAKYSGNFVLKIIFTK